jgi:hypothetical protein
VSSWNAKREKIERREREITSEYPSLSLSLSLSLSRSVTVQLNHDEENVITYV